MFLDREPDNYPVVWTILFADRFNFDARAPIDGFECALLRIPHLPISDFRIMNLRETTSDNLWDYVPAKSSNSPWKREHATISSAHHTG